MAKVVCTIHLVDKMGVILEIITVGEDFSRVPVMGEKLFIFNKKHGVFLDPVVSDVQHFPIGYKYGEGIIDATVRCKPYKVSGYLGGIDRLLEQWACRKWRTP